MDVAYNPHLIRIAKTIRQIENIRVSEVHDKTTVSPFDDPYASKFVGKDICLIYLLPVPVFHTRVLADGGRIDFYRSDGDAAVIVRCLVNKGL